MSYQRTLRRVCGALLSLILLVSSTACGLIIVNDVSGARETEAPEGGVNGNRPTTDKKTEYQKYVNEEDGLALSQTYLADLPKRDYDGAVFFITTPSADYLAPADTETSISKLVVERNAMVEEAIGVSIRASVTTADAMLTELKQNVASDSYYTDLLMIPIYRVGTFRQEETLINLRTLPFFDLDQPYFYAESSDMTSGGYATYGVAGHASIAPTAFSAVYANRAILAEAGVDVAELMDLAEAGTWTWDAFLSAMRAVTTMNESGTASRPYYTVTAQANANRLPDLIFKASGRDFIRTGKRRTPTVGYRPQNAQTVLDTIAAIYNDPYAILDGSAGAVSCFIGGESAFLIEPLSVLPEIANAVSDWGLLPLPKEDEDADYRTLVTNNESVFAVPINHTNGEYAAITLSALNAASYGYIYDEFVNYHMLHSLRDNASVNMLDMVLDTATFDFALAFGNAYPKIADATYKLLRETAKTNNLAELFEERMTTANAEMAKEFDLRT